MFKLASVALTASLGVAGLAQSAPAEAYGRMVIEAPGIVIGWPLAYAPGYYAPFYYEHGRYWRRDFDHDRYEHFDHHWDRH